ncbi:transglutaminaseTgpA domain-containing protein [Roseateles sp. DC23W]|uniref:TransglutaminaseTgpA domain-containing protein n=1 Tax=Pelomonas dachongensis TaxID=3299029 RepID=A0ABW7EJS2_9BURK
MNALSRWWHRLPRDARDSFFLLAVITAVMAPHAGHLPLWATALTALVLLWRAQIAWRQRPLPSRWWLIGIALVYGLMTWLTFRTLIGREAGITLLAVLMALKTLELRARRDAFVVFFLGFFLVLTQFLYSQSLLTALGALLSLWGLLAAVVLAQMPTGVPSIAIAARRAAATTALGLPVMVLLFVLFPRIAPLWGVPTEAIGRTGLSNQMEFGAMNEIANDDSVAMRLRFDGAVPPPDQRYFRGPVLTRFDGKTWRAPDPRSSEGWLRGRDDLSVSSPPLNYEMTLEPLRIPVLPLLEMSPGDVGAQLNLPDLTLTRGPELQWLSPRPITERMRLQTSAHTRWQAGLNLKRLRQATDLQLPAGGNPRSVAWANALATQPQFAQLAPGPRAEALGAALLAHVRANDFTYTLSPGRYGETSPHVIDEFWLDRRLGFCEHFASAFVVLMRAMGVPARIVTGFQGWDAEPQDGYFIVRNANAHAWAEFWVEGRGWVRSDPTAAVAPDRVIQGLALQPQPGVIGQFNPTLWRALRSGWETVNNRWQQLVLNYSRENQFDLLKRMGFEQPDWTALGQAIAGVIGVLALASLAWVRWSSRPHDAWSRQRARILALLGPAGVALPAHEGPAAWARALRRAHGQKAEPTAQWLERLERSRYAAQAPTPDWAEFRTAARMLRP